MSNTQSDNSKEPGLVDVECKGESVAAVDYDILQWMGSDLAQIGEHLRDLINMVDNMEKLYQDLQRTAARQELRFSMLFPAEAGEVSGEELNLLTVLGVKAEQVSHNQVAREEVRS